MLRSRPRRLRRLVQEFIKSILDCSVAALVLILSAPLWLAVMLAIRASMGGPVFFRQMRPGLHGWPFELLKFRTMRDERDLYGCPLPDGQRLTALGKMLRSLSLDELPQLWNVLRGYMSLVGPRPLLMEYLDRYTLEQARRHDVMPGITGWAQVNGRNALSWEEKFRLDVWYVDHWSLWLDIRILWLTILQVIRREGIRHEGHATMPGFAPSSQSGLQTTPPERCQTSISLF
ncbi:MAG: sugar transferase [Terracidiphilus sp.]